MRILITGAAGFIGSNLVKAVFGQMPGAVVLGIDNMNDYYDVSIKEYRLKEIKKVISDKPQSKWIFVKGNLADKELIKKANDCEAIAKDATFRLNRLIIENAQLREEKAGLHKVIADLKAGDYIIMRYVWSDYSDMVVIRY